MGGVIRRFIKPKYDPYAMYGDPMYGSHGYGVPPPYPYGPGYMTAQYDPYNFPPEFPPTDPQLSMYGSNRYGASKLGIGNTTMQFMPFMQRKVAKYAQMQGMSSLGGAGSLGGLGSFGGMMPTMPMMPMMPMMPCLPACSMPMMSPACSLPMSCNPLQAYQPQMPFQFPNSFSSAYSSFYPQLNSGGGFSCCCCACVPPPPAITFCPRPVSVPQPIPIPCPTPVAIPNIQQVPVPRPVSIMAPPIMADCNSPFSVPSGAPLMSSQGGFTQGALAPSFVMGSKNIPTKETLFTDEKRKHSNREKSIHKTIDQSRRVKAERIAASLSKLGLDANSYKSTMSKKSYPITKSTRHSHNRSYDDIPLISSSSDKSYLIRSNRLKLDTLATLANKSNSKKSTY